MMCAALRLPGAEAGALFRASVVAASSHSRTHACFVVVPVRARSGCVFGSTGCSLKALKILLFVFDFTAINSSERYLTSHNGQLRASFA